MVNFKIDITKLLIEIKKIAPDIKNDIAALERKIVPAAYDYFVKQTPVRSGRARRNTKLNKDTIVADYPYAGVLDAGRQADSAGVMRGSDQAPDGMSAPTARYILRTTEKLLQQYVRQLGRKYRG